MKSIIYISLLFIFASCKKNDFSIENLNNNKIDVLGHAGSGISNLYPINSMESILNCFNSGADGTEIDVQLTKDSILVLFHDEMLENSTNGEGRVRDFTWEELSQFNYTSSPFSSYSLIRLEDLFNNINNYQDFIYTLDIKLTPIVGENISAYIQTFSSAVKNIFDEYNLSSHVLVESQNQDFIASLQTLDSSIKQFIYPQVFETGLAIAQNMNLFGITISTNNISEQQVQEAHDLGYRITIWDVHSKNENIEAIQKNPDMIQTDRVSYLIDLLK